MRDLNSLRVFVRVAEARSFSAAARQLGLTASGVSKAVSRLEQEFGVPLLQRTTRSVALTAEGRVFHERVRHLLSDLEMAEDQLTQSARHLRGSLRVQMPLGFGRKVVLPALTRALSRHPDLTVDVELGERGVDVIEEGFDAVIRFGSLPDSGLLARRLCDIRFVPCAAPAYLARYGAPSVPADLAQHACLGYASLWQGHYRPWIFRESGMLVSREIAGQLNVNSAESLLEIAMAGAGIAMIGDFVAHDAIRSGRLNVVLQAFVAPPTQVSVLYSPARQRSPRLRWFLEMLADAVPDPAPWADILTHGSCVPHAP